MKGPCHESHTEQKHIHSRTVEYRGTDLVIVGTTHGKPREIAEILGGEFTKYDGLATCDARLITAAPDLLEACKEMLETLERVKDYLTGDTCAETGLDTAETNMQAAIDKAEQG